MFQGTSILFSKVAAPFYIPTHSTQEFQFPHILTNTCYFPGFLMVASLMAYSLWFLIYISLISDHEHLSICFLAICISSLEKCLLKVLCPFFNQVVFLLLSCRSSSSIMEINPLTDIGLANTFFHSMGYLFTLFPLMCKSF